MHNHHPAQGFSLVELLVSSTVTLLVLGATMTAFGHAMSVNDAATMIGDSSQSLRGGGRLMIRELMQVGRNVPMGGISIPSGVGVTAINRPGPPLTNYTFGDPAVTTVIPSLVPGAGLGPSVIGVPTDMFTLMMVDTTLPLDAYFLTGIAADGSNVTVDARTVINAPDTGILPGDLILFRNVGGNAMQVVSSVAGQTINFNSGDWFNLNQRTAPQGTILNLQDTPGTYPPTTAVRVHMITYYVDNNTTPTPRLTRQVNHNTPYALAGVVETLSATYDIVDGATNPTNIAAPVAPNTPQQIRKINLTMGVRSDVATMQHRRFIRNQVSTQICLRNLAFVDRYR